MAQPWSLSGTTIINLSLITLDIIFSLLCSPIPPGGTLDYTIPTDLQSGTYWIHSHFQGQYVDGLRTPLIIKPLEESYTYDGDYTIVVSDWYNDQHSVLIKQFLSIYS
jgi:iron transport multicopper oxidase